MIATVPQNRPHKLKLEYLLVARPARAMSFFAGGDRRKASLVTTKEMQKVWGFPCVTVASAAGNIRPHVAGQISCGWAVEKARYRIGSLPNRKALRNHFAHDPEEATFAHAASGIDR